MKKQGILAAAALMSCLFCGTAAAEQPAAQTYRDMLSQGTFYLEYQRDDTHYILQEQAGVRQMKSNPTGKKGDWQTEAIFKDQAYYKYQPDGKKDSFLRLPAEKMGSTLLNTTEHWESVRSKLAIPDELCAFDWDDAFSMHAVSQAQPVYTGASQRTVDGVTYDCDQYVSDIHTQADTVSGQIVYNMLYKDGKLAKVQEVLLEQGKEIPVDTLTIAQFTSEIPEGAFLFGRAVNVYAAGQGDIDELLGHKVQVEQLGGEKK
ncbi:hypothetical protein [uncultured Selenomonas sp.]|uniref:hypothetical protein n=1 Tax=uncultured Selenomonas sp. TaxID=159275 RepID=UPI0025DD6B90|nr:hypothetical protein [uncultured Selenomonas sp.]